MRNSGNYSLDELTSTVDGSKAYRVANPDIGGSWERAQLEPSADIQWECGPDDESDDHDLEVTLSLVAYASLVSRARTHCAGCHGCART